MTTSLSSSDRQALEAEARRLGIGGSTAVLPQLTDRQLHEAVLRKRAPGFQSDGRTDDAIKAAYDFALNREGGMPSNAPAATRRTETEYDAGVDARLAELEIKRLTAAQPRGAGAPAGGPTTDVVSATEAQRTDAALDADMDVKLAELERKRQAAGRR